MENHGESNGRDTEMETLGPLKGHIRMHRNIISKNGESAGEENGNELDAEIIESIMGIRVYILIYKNLSRNPHEAS